MLQVYLFCLVLAGALAALSVIGDVLDLDFLGGGDVDADVDLGLDAGGGVDVGTDVDAGAEGDLGRFFSIRGLLYGALAFGLIGSVLTFAGMPAASPVTILFAAGGGLLTGTVVGRLIAWVRGTESGALPEDVTFEGCTGRITLPLGGSSTGRVRVRRGPREYDLKALPYDAGSIDTEPERWRSVVVVEMRDGIAYVHPVEGLEGPAGDEELRLAP